MNFNNNLLIADNPESHVTTLVTTLPTLQWTHPSRTHLHRTHFISVSLQYHVTYLHIQVLNLSIHALLAVNFVIQCHLYPLWGFKWNFELWTILTACTSWFMPFYIGPRSGMLHNDKPHPWHGWLVMEQSMIHICLSRSTTFTVGIPTVKVDS